MYPRLTDTIEEVGSVLRVYLTVSTSQRIFTRAINVVQYGRDGGAANGAPLMAPGLRGVNPSGLDVSIAGEKNIARETVRAGRALNLSPRNKHFIQTVHRSDKLFAQ